MKMQLSLSLLIFGVTISQAQTTATPAISLASGSYVMPQNTTITDGTSGATIHWCYVTTGTCTPSTTYTTTIYVDPATTETICANAQASGDSKSATVCNSYTDATPAATPVISLATGSYVMPQNTTITDATSGATILWCYVTSGTCTPSTTYTTTIYVDPTTTETICANATASGYTQSATTCNSYTNQTPAAAPAITLASGTYVMPQNTTITDGTSGASILWCYVNSGTCTPATPYSASIYIDPTSTETICANATASGYTQSTTTCNSYIATSGNTINFTYSSSSGTVTMSTSLNATIFYTLDGSTATEASIEYVNPVPAAPGTTVNAVAVQMAASGAQGVALQNEQTTFSDWKTNLACYQTQCSTYVGSYNSPKLNYCPTTQDNTTKNGCQGVQGIPTQLAMTTGESVPGFGTATNLNFTDSGLFPGSTDYGTQVLWPYDTGTTGCDSCTSLVEDFYIWPGQNASKVENWELDLNSWVTTASPNVYLGASMQCAVHDGTWEYNGQNGGWFKFSSVVSSGYNHDCALPTGTITASLNNSSCNFTVAPNATTSTVEPGMILWFQDTNEEVFVSSVSGSTVTGCTRGYAGTTAASHSSGAAYNGSVHVQYHVTFIPGYTGYCHLRETPTTPAECIFIDYLTVNNFSVFNKSTYGTMVVDGKTVSKLYVDADTISNTYPDRVFDQKQIDVAAGVASISNPVQVGEYIDRDNVTASFGILASQSYTVP